jgi:hypothetical protein
LVIRLGNVTVTNAAAYKHKIVKVKVTIEQATKAQQGSKSITVLFV